MSVKVTKHGTIRYGFLLVFYRTLPLRRTLFEIFDM